MLKMAGDTPESGGSSTLPSSPAGVHWILRQLKFASQRDLQTPKLLMNLLVSTISKRINVVLIELYFARIACLVDEFID